MSPDDHGPDASYRDEPVTATAAELARWTADPGEAEGGPPRTLTGPCPRCRHVFTAPVTTVVPMAAAPESARATIEWPRPLQVTRVVTCACGETHADQPVGALGCGASWPVSLQRGGAGAWRVVPADPAMVAAADALAAQIATTDLALVRTTAERWLAALTALYGLFSLVGAVVAKDTITGLTSTGKAAVALLGLGAVALAVAAIGCGYVAAYGWPRAIEITNDEQLRAWVARRPVELAGRVPGAIRRLHQAVVCSVATLVLLSGALALMWLGPRKAAPAPVVRVSFTEIGVAQSACGRLQAAADAGIVLRIVDGPLARDQTIPLASVSRLEPVARC